ncbi:uncharacterized protein Dwil_GK20740 [Drosophila willistoni]|uniref:Uncharacterized protein n=1 Tax=Drosophila willistoni TaxID=7260 RepID=B4MJV4_DROWI|nr:uncharacterized protein LOC6638231 [Drosophila willistoni]XP_046865441.1 uncharacterized protein LOC6638231 [Drosophila willistoni]EDW72393.1 uncharacterized protein Dwil_GK20740 [Drosophila willistoni]
MPRRYTKKLKLEQLNSTIHSKAEEDHVGSSSGSEFEAEEPDPEDASQLKEDDDGEENGDDNGMENLLRNVLELTPHFSHFSDNRGMNVKLDDPIQLFPRCSVTMPVPVYIANSHTPIVEPCVLRNQAYEEWLRQLQMTLAQHKAQEKKMKDRELKHEQKIYGTHLFDMAEQIATQENSYFRDSYDYYYTGGNVQLMPFEGKTLAMHVSGHKLREIHVSEVIPNAECWKPKHSERIGAEMSSEIFEIINLESYLVNHGHFFLTRYLKEISIYEIKKNEPDEDDDDDDDNEEDTYTLKCHSNLTNQHGNFISAAQSLGQAKHLALASQDRSIQQMDMSTEQQVTKFDVCLLKSLKQSSSTWAQLLAMDANCFYYAAQPVFLTVDMRCENTNLNPCFASSLYSQQCETFSCLHRSVNPNLLYVASNHKLHCLDMRQMGKKISDRSIVTWTHQMNYPPTFMDTCVFEGDEYIVLGSALPSDQRLCELQNSLGTPTSTCLPYAPPSLDEALTDARLRGSISVYADLPERVKCCHTGLKFQILENSSDKSFAQLLTSTSIGDVYCQRFTPRDDEEKKKELRTGLHTAEAISYFANLVQKNVDQRPLKCTEVQHVSVLRDILKSDEERVAEDEKPFEVEDIVIDYGFDDSDKESENGNEANVKSPTKEQQTPTKKQQSPAKEVQPTPKAALSPPPPTPPEDEAEAEAEALDIPKQKTVNRGPWQQSAFQLGRYTDMITTRLLSVWDLEEYDQTRDVNIDMIDEKLKKEGNVTIKMEDRMANWLKNLANEPGPQREPKDEPLVPGTNLLKHYEAKYADYSEVPIPNIVPKIENYSDERRHSLLEVEQFTAIEYDFEATASTSQQIVAPKRAKPKVKHTKGF